MSQTDMDTFMSVLQGTVEAFEVHRVGEPKGTGARPDQPSDKDVMVDMSEMQMKQVAVTDLDFSLFTKPVNATTPLYTPLPYDQGCIGSCVANAVATAYRYECHRQGKPDFNPSRLFLYYVARLWDAQKSIAPPGTTWSNQPMDFYHGLAIESPNPPLLEDSGAEIRPTIQILCSLGVASEQLWPYDVGLEAATHMVGHFDPKQFLPGAKAAQAPSIECFTSAKNHFTVKYARAEKAVACWKACIRMGYPVIFSFQLWKSFNKFSEGNTKGSDNYKLEDYPLAPIPGAPYDAMVNGESHAVLAVGWKDNIPIVSGITTGGFLVQNSWGEGWAKGGMFWIPYEWLTTKDVVQDYPWTLMGSSDAN